MVGLIIYSPYINMYPPFLYFNYLMFVFLIIILELYILFGD